MKTRIFLGNGDNSSVFVLLADVPIDDDATHVANDLMFREVALVTADGRVYMGRSSKYEKLHVWENYYRVTLIGKGFEALHTCKPIGDFTSEKFHEVMGKLLEDKTFNFVYQEECRSFGVNDSVEARRVLLLGVDMAKEVYLPTYVLKTSPIPIKDLDDVEAEFEEYWFGNQSVEVELEEHPTHWFPSGYQSTACNIHIGEVFHRHVWTSSLVDDTVRITNHVGVAVNVSQRKRDVSCPDCALRMDGESTRVDSGPIVTVDHGWDD
jgi:hypothetical protein